MIYWAIPIFIPFGNFVTRTFVDAPTIADGMSNLLFIPAIPTMIGLTTGDPEVVNQLLHPTGQFAARFMMTTPLMMLFKG